MSTFIKDVRDKIISTELPKTKCDNLSGTSFGIVNVLSYEGYYYNLDRSIALVYKCQCQRCNAIHYYNDRTIRVSHPVKCSSTCKNKIIKTIGTKSTHEFRLYCIMMTTAKMQNYVVCDEWNDPDYGYDAFYNWLHNIGWNDNFRLHVIDRNKKIFSPDNVDIINNYDFMYKGEGYIVIKDYAFSIKEWAKIANFTSHLISQRIVVYGWDRKDAVLAPKSKHGTNLPPLLDVEDLVTPEWKEKNHYQFFKELGLIK